MRDGMIIQNICLVSQNEKYIFSSEASPAFTPSFHSSQLLSFSRDDDVGQSVRQFGLKYFISSLNVLRTLDGLLCSMVQIHMVPR